MLVQPMLTGLSVSTSCGFTVPYYSYEGERLLLDNYYQKVEETSPLDEATGLPTKMIENWNLINGTSIDNLPGLKAAMNPSKLEMFRPPFDIRSKSTAEASGTKEMKMTLTLALGQLNVSTGILIFMAGLAAGLSLHHTSRMLMLLLQ